MEGECFSLFQIMNFGLLATYSSEANVLYYRLCLENCNFPFHPHYLICNYLFINVQFMVSHYEENILVITLFGVRRDSNITYYNCLSQRVIPYIAS